MKKLYTIMLLAFIGLSFKANAQIVSIPDNHFKIALEYAGVHDSAGFITVDTAKEFKSNLIISSYNISDLTGIEAFTALTYLDCSLNNLTTLNLSSNTALIHLHCDNNQLTGLNLSFNTALTDLSCDYNNLTSLDLSSNIALTGLDCYNNSLTSLYLMSNTALNDLLCQNNKLTSLNLLSNIALGRLYCYNNKLTSLNLSSNTALTWLFCDNNNLTSLNLLSNTALTALHCSSDSLTSLNVKNGSNSSISGLDFNAVGNPQLNCIQVDDSAYSKRYWFNIDPWAHFSNDCNYVGINELTALTDINIYPNPLSSQLTIETNGLRGAMVNIYDVLGQLMYNRNLKDNTVSIDMNAAPAGIYILQIVDAEKNIINRKIIKQ